jgi:hypothetical protein
MMFERLKMLTRVASLDVNRQKGLDLLKQIKASDLSEDHQDRIIDIMRRMRIIRASDVPASDLSEPPSWLDSSSVSKTRRPGKE